MKKETGILKVGLWFTNVMLVLMGVATALVAVTEIVILLGGLTALKSVLASHGISMTINQALLTSGAVILVIAYFAILTWLLLNVRRFLKNVIDDRIFTIQNVKLAKQSAVLLLLLSITGQRSLFDVGYLLTALVVWVMSKILEKANAIAEENEFTI